MTTISQAIQAPPLDEFLVSPGFAGTAAVVAALIVLCAALYAGRRAGKRFDREFEQRERHHEEVRDAQQHAAATAQCWETLKWLVKTAGIEPASHEGATLGLGPELAMAILRGLLRDAERLGDETLADAVTVYQNQFALILAQQGGPLAELAAKAPGPQTQPTTAKSPTPQLTSAQEATTPSDGKPAKQSDKQPDRQPAPDEAPTTATEVATGERRRRR
ncbi:hypothetical protein CQY20_09040 [Mycolicibacterium agri]|uniref:Uncharacterized protein n=1 Tax=Mycolicibacterium agri TaxID=36811 RepID=A0A2A7N8H3_MYCAG|nr:hypothetical protein [Mycolicibacterium agri]PEG40017.1 hypothetical protein CQY20_09040 [Mycolicibacterium agri]GFG51533.1 hypothetical protein MAGR_29740 [Mycolicibacterium agri]